MPHDHDHDHDHDHAHEHGPDCTCGCHDHDHDHDHDNDRLHKRIELGWAHAHLEAHTHEQAATVSADIHPQGDGGRSFADLVAIMQDIAQISERAGGIVGHIKGFARQGGSFAHASVTAADLDPTLEGDQSLTLDEATEIQLVAIVLLVSQDALLEICTDALSA